MDPSGTDNFENQWRKAFEEASENPAPNLWEKIEAQLDDADKGQVIPLWWKSSKLWLAAASLAGLILVAGGIWYSSFQQSNIHSISTLDSENKPSDSAKQHSKTYAENTGSPRENDIASANKTIAGNKNQNADLQESSALENSSEKRSSSKKSDRRNRNGLDHMQLSSTQQQSNQASKRPEPNADDNISMSQETDVSTPATLAYSKANEVDNSMKNSQIELSYDLLNSLSYQELDVHVQNRYVFFRPESISPKEEKKLTTKREYWAGIGVMPSSFNPNLKVKEAPTAFAYQSLSNRKSVSGTSQSGMSYALQSSAGMKLSKHWSLEMGVSYLQGNSTYQGGGYLLNSYNSRSANVLEDALAGLAAYPSSTDKTNGFLNTGSMYIDVAKKVNNNYQFLQMPVQAGFTLRPDKKLSYSILGGMMANFFLSNDLESASGEIITTTAMDDIYRDLSWATTAGLRFNYRLSSKWNANLTGSYQRSLTSGFRSNQNLDAHPYLYGIAWGVRYSF